MNTSSKIQNQSCINSLTSAIRLSSSSIVVFTSSGKKQRDDEPSESDPLISANPNLSPSSLASSSAEEDVVLFDNFNFYQLCFIQFMSAFGNSAYLATNFLYLSEEFEVSDAAFWSGVTFASYAACQGLGGLVIGKIADRFSLRAILLVTQVVDIIANGMYAFATEWQLTVISRAVSGIASSNLVIGYGYITTACVEKMKSEIPSKMGFYQACQSMGFLLGPLVSLLLGMANYKSGPIVIDEYTSPAWTCLLLQIGSFSFLFFYFKITDSFKQMRSKTTKITKDEEVLLLSSESTIVVNEKEESKFKASCRLSFLIHFTNWCLVGIIRVTMTPILNDDFDYSSPIISIIVSAIAIYCAVLFRIVGRFATGSRSIESNQSKSFKLKEERILSIAFLFAILGNIVCVDFIGFTSWQYFLGLSFQFASYTIFTIIIPSIYGELGLKHHVKQGEHMSHLTLVMAIALAISPLLGGILYEYIGDSWIFSICAIGYSFSFVVYLLCKKEYLYFYN